MLPPKYPFASRTLDTLMRGELHGHALGKRGLGGTLWRWGFDGVYWEGTERGIDGVHGSWVKVGGVYWA